MVHDTSLDDPYMRCEHSVTVGELAAHLRGRLMAVQAFTGKVQLGMRLKGAKEITWLKKKSQALNDIYDEYVRRQVDTKTHTLHFYVGTSKS